MRFSCKFQNCIFNSHDSDEILSHYTFNHTHVIKFQSRCFFDDCGNKKVFNRLCDMENHVRNKHRNELRKTKAFLKCDVLNCQSDQLIDNIDDLYLHYYKHLTEIEKNNKQREIKIKCFFQDCYYVSSDANSKKNFQKHLSERHTKSLEYLSESVFIRENENNLYESEDVLDDFRTDFVIEDENLTELNLRKKRICDENKMTNLYMQLYHKLKDKYLIAKYKVDEIFEDINTLIRINNNDIINLIDQTRLTYQNDSRSLNIVREHLKDSKTLIQNVHKYSKNDSKKDKWLKESGFYNMPKEISLSNKPLNQNIKEETFQYVPILETIKALLSHPQLNEQYFKEKLNDNNKILTYNDSVFFKSNQLFRDHENAVQIVLFVDDYDTSNPLGDLRNEKKLTGIYYKIGNFDQSFKSVDYFTQLAIICEAKYIKKYGFNKVLKPLIEDLKLLETSGIEIEVGGQKTIVKGTISYLSSDNLAANSIGGFVESFKNC
jgi:hypothetical protein